MSIKTTKNSGIVTSDKCCFNSFWYVSDCSCVYVSAGKTVLIVYAHQSPTSFNFAARKVAEEALKEQGCKVLISDLYAMDFEASATRKDFSGTALLVTACIYLRLKL